MRMAIEFVKFSLLTLLVVFWVSCGKRLEYIPLLASNISNEFFVTLEDEVGNNKITPQLIETLLIKGKETGEKSVFFMTEEDGKTALKVLADFPNANKYREKIWQNGDEFSTECMLIYRGQHLPITCVFVYFSLGNSNLYGGTGIHLCRIICDGIVFQKTMDTKKIILPLVKTNGSLSVKK